VLFPLTMYVLLFGLLLVNRPDLLCCSLALNVRGEPVTMGILSEYRELGALERAISRSPNSGLTECTYGCGLNLEHCSKSQQLDTGYVYIYKEAWSASGLPPLIGGNLAACRSTITLNMYDVLFCSVYWSLLHRECLPCCLHLDLWPRNCFKPFNWRSTLAEYLFCCISLISPIANFSTSMVKCLSDFSKTASWHNNHPDESSTLGLERLGLARPHPKCRFLAVRTVSSIDLLLCLAYSAFNCCIACLFFLFVCSVFLLEHLTVVTEATDNIVPQGNLASAAKIPLASTPAIIKHMTNVISHPINQFKSCVAGTSCKHCCHFESYA